jgi:hypothetical protein
MGDLPNEIEATQIGGFRSDRIIAGKLAPGSFGLLQQYRGTQKTVSPAAGGSAYCGAADAKCSRRVRLSMTDAVEKVFLHS